MEAVVLGVDYSNIGSLAMLDIVKRQFKGKIYECCHVAPSSIGVKMEEQDKVVVLRLRTCLKALITPKCFWFLMLNDSERSKLSIFDYADIVFDISGFALSNMFPIFSNIRYLALLYMASRYGKRVVILPQAFGPFQYRYRWFFIRLIRHALRGVEKIFARDNQSLRHLSNIGITAFRAFDLVYLYDYRQQPEIHLPDNVPCVGIVPNVHLCEFISENQLIDIYLEILRGLDEKGFSFIFFSHTQSKVKDGDLEIVKRVASSFQKLDLFQPEKHFFIDRPLSIGEVNYLYAFLWFIIGSRFHALVLNYTNRKPAVAVGWAAKYLELANEFEQSQYVISADPALSAKIILGKVDDLIANYDTEIDKISSRLSVLRKRCQQAMLPYLPGAKNSRSFSSIN